MLIQPNNGNINCLVTIQRTRRCSRRLEKGEDCVVGRVAVLLGCLDDSVQLNNLDLSLSEIASICSFPDSSYLSRFFKKIMGISPNEYRLKRISGSEL